LLVVFEKNNEKKKRIRKFRQILDRSFICDYASLELEKNCCLFSVHSFAEIQLANDLLIELALPPLFLDKRSNTVDGQLVFFFFL